MRKRSACLAPSCFFARSSPLVPLSSWLDAIVHPRRVCSRVITIASQHEPTAESRSATRGSFNIDNNPTVRVTRVFLSVPRPFTAPFSFPLSSRVTALFRFFFARWLLSMRGAWLRTLRAFTPDLRLLLAVFNNRKCLVSDASPIFFYSNIRQYDGRNVVYKCETCLTPLNHAVRRSLWIGK